MSGEFLEYGDSMYHISLDTGEGRIGIVYNLDTDIISFSVTSVFRELSSTTELAMSVSEMVLLKNMIGKMLRETV